MCFNIYTGVAIVARWVGYQPTKPLSAHFPKTTYRVLLLIMLALVALLLLCEQGSSSTARQLAMDVSAQIQADQIFDFRRQQG